MTIYATGNPVGSTSPKDLIDNAQNLDYKMLGPLLSYPDRRGVNRLSWAGIEASFAAAQTQRASEYTADKLERDTEFAEDQAERAADFLQAQGERNEQFNAYIDSTGFENPPLVYVDGVPLQVDRITQLVSRGGNLYTAKRPATFPVTLTGTWSTDSPNLVLRNDQSVRQDLAEKDSPILGAAMVGFRGRDVFRKLGDHKSPRDYGGICDGVSRTLGSIYPTLAAAQAVYPHATSLSDQLDWAAIQLILNNRYAVDMADCWARVNRPSVLKFDDGYFEMPGGSVLMPVTGWAGRAAIEVGTATQRVDRCYVDGKGRIEGVAGLLPRGIEVVAARRSSVSIATVRECSLGGVHIGTAPLTGAAGSYEVHAGKISIQSTEGQNGDPAGVGFFFGDNCGDCSASEIIVLGYRTAFKSTTPANHFLRTHAWTQRANGPMSKCYDITGNGNVLVDAYSDTPSNLRNDGTEDPSISEVYGFYIDAFNVKMIVPRVFMNGANGHAVTDKCTGIYFNKDNSVSSVFAPNFSLSGEVRYKALAGYPGVGNVPQVGIVHATDGGSATYITKGFSGSGQVPGIGASGQFELSGPAATNRRILLTTGGSSRWAIDADNVAESGSQVGSDFSIQRYNDAGASIDKPLRISRDTGVVNIGAGTTGDTSKINFKTAFRGGGATPATVARYIRVQHEGAEYLMPLFPYVS